MARLLSRAGRELVRHLPYTATSAICGLALIAVARLTVPVGIATFGALLSRLFHVLHPLHMLFSSAATSAVYFRYRPSPVGAWVVGLLAGIGVCTVSDALLPFAGAQALGLAPELHLCLMEHWHLSVLAAGLGAGSGILWIARTGKPTYLPHSAHVLVSSMASVTYLTSYSTWKWSVHILGLALVATVAVLVPCCFSDVVLPVLAAGAGGDQITNVTKTSSSARPARNRRPGSRKGAKPNQGISAPRGGITASAAGQEHPGGRPRRG